MRPLAHRQRGGTALLVALVLAMLSLLTAAFTHHGVLFEHHSAVNQQHAVQAAQAADAGLGWALAQMNRAAAIGSDCRPLAGGNSFRARQAAQAALARPLEAACTLEDGHWACHCPASGAATWPGTASATRFRVQLLPTSRPEQVQMTARGCVGTPAACEHPEGDDPPQANAVVQATLARLSALGATPASALTVRGQADLRGSQLGLHSVDNADTDAITLHSGGTAQLGSATLHVAPGTPALTSIADGDDTLAALSADGLFANLFRLGRGDWQHQPVARRVQCPASGACDDALRRAMDEGGDTPLLWIAGPLQLDRAETYGSAERPVLWVVDGAVALNAPLTVHGLLYVTAAAWSDTAGAQVRGAVVAEGDFRPTGTTQIHHDPEALARLRRLAGTDAVVPGSWRDFIAEEAP